MGRALLLYQGLWTRCHRAGDHLGVPVWVFWSIVIPWMLANIFTFWFCLFYMADDDLGEGDEA